MFCPPATCTDSYRGCFWSRSSDETSLTPTTMEKPPTAGDVYVHSSKGLASSPGMALSLVHIVGTDLYTSHAAGNTEVPTRVVSIWRQGKAKVNHLLGNKPPETPTRHESDPSTPPPIHQSRPPTPPTWLTSPPKLPAPLPHTPPPYDIAVVIIAYLTHDLRTLKACSLTCRSFFMAAAPHIYHTITLDEARGNRSRLEPLSTLRELGLMPYTREIRVRSGAGSSSWLLPRAFSHFSAFTNVHTLKIQNMEVYRFVPGVERYFGHFSPTLRSITLYNPRCTPRQLSYFLSLFPNLDDINISTETVAAHIPNTTVPDTGLVPFSTSGLRGRLALYEFSWVETLTSLIALGGGLRFRQMDLRRSECCTPLLFEACAKTLETLRFHANDRPVGE